MLTTKLSAFNVILASGSPRRHQFLKDLNINFKIETKKVNEIYPDNLEGCEITNYLADLKSKPFDNFLTEKDILITSDTIVWFKEKALGKPANFEESFQMISDLSDNMHEVITSVSLKNNKKQVIFSDLTKVYFKKLSSEEITYYINNYHPFDKAGSYGIQEWIGQIGVKKIEGSYFNVMGLPIDKLYDELMKF